MFGSKKVGAKVIAVFDISSSSVGGAHAIVPKTGLPTQLASNRIDAVLQDDIDVKRFIDDTAKNLTDVAFNLHKADVHHPDHIQLVLAAPWYVSQTRAVLYKKEEPFICTKKVIDDLVNKEIEYIISHDFKWFGSSGKEGIVVEKQISQVKLNGYSTSAPYGKKTSSIELFLTLTVVPKKVIDRFTDSLRRQYGTRKVGITTSPYATFVITRDYFQAKENSVIIDVGEEVTDIAFVKNGLFLSQHSFPVGTYGLYRSVVTKSKSTILEAKALIEMYRLGKASMTAKNKIDKAIVSYALKWQQGLQTVVSDGKYGFCFPEHCYITADQRFEGVFQEIIVKDAFIQHVCVSGAINPLFLTMEHFRDKIKSLDQEVDVPLATGILFTSRIM